MRRLIAIIAWSVAYVYASSVKIHDRWGMSVFNLNDWKDAIGAWRSGRVVIDTPNEYAFYGVLLLWIPVWMIGCFLIFRMLRPKIPHVVQLATASHPFIPAYTPTSMPSQGKSAVVEPPAQPQNSEPLNPEPEMQTDWVPKDTGEAHGIEVITQIAESNGLTPFPHVLLENELIPITISSDADAFLIKVLAVQGNWQVGMTEPLEQSQWTCNGQSKNVLKEIVLGKGILSKMEPEAKVIPVVVLAQGSLENKETALSWLAQCGIEVVTLPENPQSNIPQLSETLIKYFGPLQQNQEEQNEVEPSASVQTASV